jgi:methyl-accepting chemotaxis protein
MKSVKVKIMVGLSLAIVIPVTLLFGLVFRAFYTQTLDRRVDAVAREIDQLDNAMTLFMDHARETVSLLSASPLLRQADGPLTSYVATTARTRVVPRDDDAAGRAITAFFKQFQDAYKPYVEVYFGSEDGGFVSGLEYETAAGFDPRKRPWYKDAMATPDRPVIAKAYMATSGEAVVTAARAAMADGRRIGAVGVDISLRVLTDLIKAIKIGRTGYVVFVQGDGVVISNPRDPSQNFKKIAELGQPGMEEAFRLGARSAVLDLGGERVLALCHDAPRLGWKLLAFVDYDEVVGPMRALMWRVALGLAAMLLVVFLFVSSFLRIEIFRPLHRMIGQLEAIGAGRYGERLAVRRRDEVGQVCEALDQMSATLAGHVREIEARRAEAERTAREAEDARRQAEEARLRAESARVEGMRQAADRLKRVVEIVSAAAAGLSARIGEAGHGAEQQAGRIRETATAVEQMAASVLEIARNAGLTAALADRTRNAAAAGRAQVEKVRDDTRDINEGFRELYTAVSDLSAKADGIGTIARTIEDIADQTNLLALNAAIEAARAGEAGRGFAVVADEVRKLAEKTMVATKEVGEAVSGIQHGVGGTLSGVDRARRHIELSIGQTEEAAVGLGSILTLVGESTDQVRAIAAAAEEQSAATEEINRHIGTINGVSSETAGAMQHATEAVAELARQVEALRGLIAALEAEGGDGGRRAIGA